MVCAIATAAFFPPALPNRRRRRPDRAPRRLWVRETAHAHSARTLHSAVFVRGTASGAMSDGTAGWSSQEITAPFIALPDPPRESDASESSLRPPPSSALGRRWSAPRPPLRQFPAVPGPLPARKELRRR